MMMVSSPLLSAGITPRPMLLRVLWLVLLPAVLSLASEHTN
eukprot:SAG31_NODE_17007_length_686_cov_4.340716_2_plen_40_part_01